MRIDIKTINLKGQKITGVKEQFVQLELKYLRYKADFRAEEPIDNSDLTLGWKENDTFFDLVVKKENVIGCEISLTLDRKWLVTILCQGLYQDPKAYFNYKEYNSALDLFEKINVYILA